MKKNNFKFTFIILLSLLSLLLVSCGVFQSRLSQPSGLMLDIETQTVKWNAVKNAKYYTVRISGEEKEFTTKDTSFSVEYLAAGQYEISIKANGDGEVFDDSEWKVYPFERAAESGLKYQLINNDTAYQLVGGGKASGDVVMESIYRGKPVVAIADKALYGNTKITGFTVGENVTTIGDKAFSKCSKLTSVTIPEGVSSIGEYVFQSCKALTSITLPDSVTVLAPYSFAWCSALTEVKLSRNLTAISEYAFSNCETLGTITYNGAPDGAINAVLPDTMVSIGTYAFSDCEALTGIDLGGTQTIDQLAFSGCKALATVDFGNRLVTLGSYAFHNCVLLEKAILPDTTKTVSEGAFYGCSALGEVVLGKGLRDLSYNVFAYTALMTKAASEELFIVDGWLIQVVNNSIDKLNLKEGVHGLASYALYGCSKLEQATFKGVQYVNYAAFANSALLYRVVFDDALIAVDDYAFYNCPYLANVDLGAKVGSIGSYAFASCAALVTMGIPDSITTIGTYAFRNTGAYTTVYKSSTKGVVYMGGWAVDYVPSSNPMSVTVINDGTKGIANYTFSNQTVLLFSIPDSVEYIGRGAFYKCQTYLINLPASLKQIGDYAFYNCSYTTFGDNYALVIPTGTEYIGRSAFYNCTNVLSLTVPGSVKTIGPYAFFGCQSLGATGEIQQDTGEKNEDGTPIVETVKLTGFVDLGEGIEYIGDRAFQNCISLTKITIPNSVTYLGVRAFYKCAELTSVTLGSGLREISEYAFYKCEKLESVTVSPSLDRIGNYAFRGCIALKSFDFGQITSIGRYSFYGCTALEYIVLPRTLISVGDYAFRGCANATAIVIPDSLQQIGKHVFYGLKNTTLYIEAGQAGKDWSYQFNSSFRPVFWGCTLSEDNGYVVSVIAGANKIVNSKATNGISDPKRSGYVFGGWATSPDSVTPAYTSQNVDEAADGTVLYAIWTQQP